MKRLLTIIFAITLSTSLIAQSTVKDEIQTISKRYGVNFVYDPSLAVDSAVKGKELKYKSLQSDLKVLFAGTGISWEIRENYVLLTQSKSRPSSHTEISSEKTDTITAASITGRMDRGMNFTQTGLTKLDGDVFKRGFSLFSAPDVLKTLQALPGVAAGTEMLSNLYVHGGDGTDNMFLLDGVPLYQICHLGGIFSSFNTDIIENLDFYKSGFPARYGGRTSSVVDISTKDGSFNKYGGCFSIGLLEGRINVEGPIVKDKTSFNLAIRRSWADAVMYPTFLIINRINKTYDNDMSRMAGYSFTDANAKITHRFGDGSRLSFNIYAGQDGLRYKQDDVTSFTSLYKVYQSDNMKLRMSWGNILASANWKKDITENLSVRLCGYWSGSRNKIGYYEDFMSETTELETGETNSQIYKASTSNKGILDDTGITADFDWNIGRNHHLRLGSSYIWHRYNPSFENSETEEDVELKTVSQYRSDSLLANAHEVSIYAEDEMKLTNWLRANIGLRNTVYIAYGKAWNSFEPRMAVKFQCSPSVNIKLSYSEMSQFSHQVATTYLDLPTNCWMPSGTKISPMRSRQVSGGVYGKLPYNLHLNVEGWYKTMDNLVEYSGMNAFISNLADWESNFNVGKGRSYGMEVDFGYETKSLSVNAFYTLSWTQRRFDSVWPDWYRDRNDNRHKFTLQANWRLNKKWEFYGAWNYHSGNRMTVATQYVKNVYETGDVYNVDLWGELTCPSQSMWLYEAPNNIKLPDYHRLDLGMNVHITTKKGRESIWNLSIYNVYSRINPVYAYVKKVNGTGENFGKVTFQGIGIGIIPILPSFSYTLVF